MADLFNAPAPAPKVDPRLHVCARCSKPGAVCGQAGQWFCWGCQPADWVAPERRAA